MTNAEIHAVLEQHYADWLIQPTVEPPMMQWGFQVSMIDGLIQTRMDVDRLLILANVSLGEPLEASVLLAFLKTNYGATLDARYALTQDGGLVVVFRHPLRTLTRELFQSAIYQVVTCARTGGTIVSQ